MSGRMPRMAIALLRWYARTWRLISAPSLPIRWRNGSPRRTATGSSWQPPALRARMMTLCHCWCRAPTPWFVLKGICQPDAARQSGVTDTAHRRLARGATDTCPAALPATGRSAQRPPGGDLRLLRDRKIATRLKRMARRASGLVARVADGDNTAHQLREYLFVFRGYRHEASGGIVCTHSASAPAPPPLNFTLAPRNADRIVAPE